jgi:large subunit ribosomal protein L5
MAAPSGAEAVKQNPMRSLRIEKVTANINTGKSGEPLEKAKKVLAQITGQKPCERRAKRTIKDFGIRRGEPIACIVTLRRERAQDFLKRAFEAIGRRLPKSCFDNKGNFAFGIKEHIEIPGAKYVPELGIFGMNVCVTLERPGYRVKRRSIRRSNVGGRHLINAEEAMQFVRENFGVEIVGE